MKNYVIQISQYKNTWYDLLDEYKDLKKAKRAIQSWESWNPKVKYRIVIKHIIIKYYLI